MQSTEHPLHYSYGFTRTHGIYKAGTKNHWLVEVSAANGVLAMPLGLGHTELGDYGYLVGLEFADGYEWDRQKWTPDHLLAIPGDDQ